MAENTDYGPRELDTSIPSAARAYDYYLGGAHNFEVDRAFAEQIVELMPHVRRIAELNRAFLRRVVRYLLSQGIRQFLDIGSGIPTAGNVHEIAQQQAPESRIVYVDYEAMAYNHARLLLADNPNAAIIQADLREPNVILNSPTTHELIDFSQPVGLLMVGVLLFISPEDRPADLVAQYRDQLVPGSFFAASQMADEGAAPEQQQQLARLVAAYQDANESVFVRTREEFATWFDGMELVPPGVTYMPDWQPDEPVDVTDVVRPLGYGAVGRVT